MGFAVFDTLEYVKLLTKAGFNQQQAEGLNEAQQMLTQAVLSQVATHADLQNLRTDLRLEMQEMCSELQKEIADIKPYVLKAVISTMVGNFALMAIGVGVLALI